MVISELSATSGVPVTTIKFYIREELLQKPIKTGQTRANYTQKHLNRLKLIQKIKEDGSISLKKIKEIVQMIDIDDESIQIAISKDPLMQRTEIIDVSMRIFREKGYDAATVTDIIKELNVGRSTFYKHFANKKEVFLECIQNVLQKESAGLGISDGKGERDVIKLFNMHADVLYRVDHLWRDMINMLRAAALSNPDEFSDKLDEVMRLKIETYKNEIQRGIEYGIFGDVDREVLAVMVLGIQEYCSAYLLNEPLVEKQKKVKEKETLEAVKKILLFGILKR